MRKMMVTLQDDINLELITILTSLSLNGSISGLHGEKPSMLLCGHDFTQLPNLKREENDFIPTMVKTTDLIQHKQKNIKQMMKKAKIIGNEHHKTIQEQRNKSAVHSKFEKGQILFHKDMSKPPVLSLIHI